MEPMRIIAAMLRRWGGSPTRHRRPPFESCNVTGPAAPAFSASRGRSEREDVLAWSRPRGSAAELAESRQVELVGSEDVRQERDLASRPATSDAVPPDPVGIAEDGSD